MERTTYIQPDSITANLAELHLLKMESFELIIRELAAKVCTLTNPLDYSQLFTEEQTIARLNISPPTIYRLRKNHEINYRKLGKIIRYSLGDIVEYEERCKR